MADFEKKQYLDFEGLKVYNNGIKTWVGEQLDPINQKDAEQDGRLLALETNAKDVEQGAEKNIIEVVKVNGTPLEVNAADRSVDVPVPTGALASKDQVAEADLETTLATKLNGKADKATTLAGYGITDAYTKDEADAKFAPADIDTGIHSVALASGTNDKTLKLTVNGEETDNIEVTNIYSKTEADAAAKVTLTTAGTATEGYLKTYVIAQNGTEIGKIDIPKELVVTSGQVVVNPAGQEEGKYIKLTIANQDTPIYINVKDLVDVYTAIENEYEENGLPINSVSVNISDDNVISAFVLENGIQTFHLRNKSVTGTKIATKTVGETNIADSAIGTRSIIDKTVTLAKLEQNVQDTLNNSASTYYVDNAIQALDADVTSAEVEEGKGIRVQVVEADGKVTNVAVTGNYDAKYDALGEAAAVYAAIGSIPLTGENSIESLFA